MLLTKLSRSAGSLLGAHRLATSSPTQKYFPFLPQHMMCLPYHSTATVFHKRTSIRTTVLSNRTLPSPLCLVTQSRTLIVGVNSETRRTKLLEAKTGDITGRRHVFKKIKIAESLVNAMPYGMQPYLKLMRIDKPIGTWLLFWPCGWSLGLATSAGSLPDPYLFSLFATGAFIMRGAGCTINDMWDRNLDSAVERTRDRPITSGRVSLFDALVFLGGQLGLGLLILLQLNLTSVLLGVSVMGLVVTYPLMKRFTYYPQFVLGMAFNWGAILGWSAVHDYCNLPVCLSLYVAGISWTMIYDTIYAHQDKYDDVIVGIKSTAIKFGEQTPVCLGCFATLMMSSLVCTGWLCQQTLPFYASVAAIGVHLSHQLYTLDIDNREDCAKKFQSNRWIGLLLFLGIVSGTYMKEETKEEETTTSQETNIPILARL